MISKDYTDERVILEFQKTVIIPANEKFSTIFKWRISQLSYYTIS